MAEMTLLQSTAATVVGRGYLSADHLSTATGLDPAIMISKAGGNFANPAAGASIMTEIEATGWYKFALGVGDTDTLGALIIRGTHAGMDNIEVVYQVVAANVAANVTQWLSQACAAVTVNGVPEVDVTHWLGTAAAVPSVAGVPEVDITYGAGTAIAAGAIPNVAAGSVGGLAVIGLNANGYDGGWVWFDTAGAAGAVNYVNGTVLNPCSSMANCRTIANSLNLKGFRVINGSTVTLDQGYNGFTFFGYKWVLALANRSIAGSFFSGATVSGTATGTGAVFDNCDMGIVTLDPCTFQQCVFTGTITVGTAGNYTFERCQSQLTAGVDPIIDFVAAVGATTINLRSWSGGVSVANMKAGDILEIDGSGKLVIAASCTAGTVRIRGNFTLTNGGSGQTIEDTARWNEDQRLANVTLVDTTTLTTTATNLTNAPTVGDFTAVMKTSLNAATPASVVGAVGSVTGAVGSVTGNVGGNVVGSVASVTGAVGSVTGAVGSVTGAVGSVTGNVGGNVTGSVGSVTGAVGSVTGNVGGNVTGSIGSLAAQAKLDVNAEALDVLNVDTYAEPAQGAPAATASLAAKINYLYKVWRNKKTQTATQTNIYNDAGAVIDHKATVSDDGVTFTKGEVESGP